MNDADCSEVLESKLHYTGKIKKAKKDFASSLNAIGSQKD